MGRTTSTMSQLIDKEKGELGRFRRALRKEDQIIFDKVWAYARIHMMASTQANHLLPFETALFAMILEQEKELDRLREEIEKTQRNQIRQGDRLNRIGEAIGE